MSCRLPSCLALLFLLLVPVRAQQNSRPADKIEGQKYANTSDGLQRLIEDILQAAKAKDTIKENDLIQSLLMSGESTWFTDVYGPGLGSSLAAAYRRATPNLEQEIRTIYDGNVHDGWKPRSGAKAKCLSSP